MSSMIDGELHTEARMVKLVDTRDLKSLGPSLARAGSTPAPGTIQANKQFIPQGNQWKK
jgi:hypothetical protein